MKNLLNGDYSNIAMIKDQKQELTFNEELFLKELKFYINEYGYTPTIREFGKHIGLNSPATVYYYLKRLEQKGYIKRINNRNIEILKGEDKE